MEREIEENTIKSESEQPTKKSFWQNPKVPLFIAVFFVILTVVVSSVLVLSSSRKTALDNTTSNKIVIATDKESYVQGDAVTITVVNNLNKTIYFPKLVEHNNFWLRLESLEQGKWRKSNAGFLGEGGEPPVEKIIELKPGRNKSMNWGLSLFNVSTLQKKFIGEGTYRLRFHYAVKRLGISEWKDSWESLDSVVSNQFKVEGPAEIGMHCGEKVSDMLSKCSNCFESYEDGVNWCIKCIENDGIPTLSYDIGPFCNSKTSDAGKSCADSKECEGLCVARSESLNSGFCSETESVRGCIFELKDGETKEICYE